MQFLDDRLELEGFQIVFRDPSSDTTLTIVLDKLVWPKLADDPTNIVQCFATAAVDASRMGGARQSFEGRASGSVTVESLLNFGLELTALQRSLQGTVQLVTLEGSLDLRLSVVNRARGAILVQAEVHAPFGGWAQSGELHRLCQNHGNPATLRFAFLTDQSYMYDANRDIGSLLTYLASLRGSDRENQ